MVWCVCFCFFKQKTAYEMRISDWSSDVCSSDLRGDGRLAIGAGDADGLVRRQIAFGFGEKFDVADDGDMRFARVRGDRVAVERHAGRNDDAREADQVDLERVDRKSTRLNSSH